MFKPLDLRPYLLTVLLRRKKKDAVYEFQRAIFLVFALLFVGTVGYKMLEGMTVIEALYMTVITLTTVGFGEVRPLSEGGRVFTIALILMGVTAIANAIQKAVEVTLGQHLWISLREREINKQLEQISDHYIICGYGRMGREIVKEFRRHGKPFVVIDQEESFVPRFLDNKFLYVIGNATHDEVLLAAGIERASGLLTILDSDADNVLIVLSAKGLNKNLHVVARAGAEEMESKLHRAGADNVTSPYVIGGQRMAFALVRPAVYNFLNLVVYNEEQHSEMGQLCIQKGSPLVGLSLRESHLRSHWGAIVVAIVEQNAQITISPDPNRKLTVGDTLIIVAPTENLRQLEDELAGT
jgi:voltage-gated potassium channel